MAVLLNGLFFVVVVKLHICDAVCTVMPMKGLQLLRRVNVKVPTHAGAKIW
jgi:hypothetical protein